jgi:glycosyltransferase involved in cell wall biosynthesis
MFEGILQAHLMSRFHRIPFVVEDQFDPWAAGGRLGRCSYHQAVRRCRVAISVSQRGADYLQQVAGVPANRIKTVYNPARSFPHSSPGRFPLEWPQSSSRSPRPCIGTVCRLDDSHKKVSHLLQAAQILSPQVRVLIVGDGPDRSRLERLARQGHPRLDALFVGHQDDPGPFLRAMEIFILPSAHDALPLSLAEAMLQERCCVGSRVGGISEMLGARQDDDLGECGRLFDPGNHVALADAIRNLLDDAPTRRLLGQKAHQRAGRLFAPTAHARKMELSYRQALGQRTEE